ncbi:MAG TPA: hypothetical protein V6C50_08250 [Crinalium sp.]
MLFVAAQKQSQPIVVPDSSAAAQQHEDDDSYVINYVRLRSKLVWKFVAFCPHLRKELSNVYGTQRYNLRALSCPLCQNLFD